MGRGFLGQEIHLPIRVHPLAGGVPDWMSAGRPSNTTGLLKRKPRVSHRQLRLTQTLEPSGMRPQLGVKTKGTMPAAPHHNYILVTPAAVDRAIVRRRRGLKVELARVKQSRIARACPAAKLKAVRPNSGSHCGRESFKTVRMQSPYNGGK